MLPVLKKKKTTLIDILGKAGPRGLPIFVITKEYRDNRNHFMFDEIMKRWHMKWQSGIRPEIA